MKDNMTIGLIAHAEKPHAAEVARAMVAALGAAGLPHLLEHRTAELAGRSSDLATTDLAERCDLLVVMGGDGTILRAVQQMPTRLPTIVGINTGSLGFLTCFASNEIDRAVESIGRRDFTISHRRLLEADLHLADGSRLALRALNDVVASRGERSQLVRIRALIDGHLLTDYNADGLVVATPTGSTAYSLSAGGPILLPDCGAFVVTPICPHVLTNRSVVVDDNSVITIEVPSPGQSVHVSVDAELWHTLSSGDSLTLRGSTATLPLAMPPGRHFSEVLQQKLKWSGSNV